MLRVVWDRIHFNFDRTGIKSPRTCVILNSVDTKLIEQNDAARTLSVSGNHAPSVVRPKFVPSSIIFINSSSNLLEPGTNCFPCCKH
mmetsp:Transcript_28526/g.32012  ORF Transcript_28526/g.32012 Transcript_28526/m.32012 type:complete len:87 (+) Transcript_28526:311-571(+)